jgi:hypothetical protein
MELRDIRLGRKERTRWFRTMDFYFKGLVLSTKGNRKPLKCQAKKGRR